MHIDILLRLLHSQHNIPAVVSNCVTLVVLFSGLHLPAAGMVRCWVQSASG